MRLVIIESPYAGAIEKNLRYLRACMHDCLMRAEAPMASHGLYTQPGVLDDKNPAERMLGMEAGFSWRKHADLTVVYTDMGHSRVMEEGIRHAVLISCPIEYRSLGPVWDSLCGT